MAASKQRKTPSRRKPQSSNGRVGSAELVARAVEQVAMLTGRRVEGVLGLERRDEGWLVTVEIVELRRVPDSTDVLASYAVALDKSGELEGYKRIRRYYRSQVEEEE